eukprot:scaffold24582_cov74-Cyclotella_meneghiniana.AAC.3
MKSDYHSGNSQPCSNQKQYESSGFGSLPICIAKTQYSFSCDANAKGVPTGFRIFVREIRSCVGAGFLYPICGDIMTIPGLPTRPGFYDVDIDTETGQISAFHGCSWARARKEDINTH